VGPRVLFNGHDIYDVVEIQKDKLKKTYEALPDDKALDEAFTQDLKKQYTLDIPRLRPDEWTSERKDTSPQANEIVVYVPFDGDPSVFGINLFFVLLIGHHHHARRAPGDRCQLPSPIESRYREAIPNDD
jgi:hypothetical protein